jgi:predicted metal-dependent hydrolase
VVAKPARDSFTYGVQLEFILNPLRRLPAADFVDVNGRQVPVSLIRNVRARRYVLRLRPDGSARVTIPRGGSVAEARRFLARNQSWLERQLQKLSARPAVDAEWRPGTEILFRGERVKLETGETGAIHFGNERVRAGGVAGNLRPLVERHLWRLAAGELPCRVQEFAAAHQLSVRRVSVRNQRSRWGSCSRHGTVSLNWRLIQAPPFVSDYIILHELMHLRQMNHSARFWREVERVCPGYDEAERWLKQHADLLK